MVIKESLRNKETIPQSLILLELAVMVDARRQSNLGNMTWRLGS